MIDISIYCKGVMKISVYGNVFIKISIDCKDTGHCRYIDISLYRKGVIDISIYRKYIIDNFVKISAYRKDMIEIL